MKVDIKQIQKIAKNEEMSIYRKKYFWIFRCGNTYFCGCDEIIEKDGIFSFVDSKKSTLQGLLNKSEFAYATRNY